MEDIKIEKFTVYDIESEYSKFTSIDHRKKFAQFFTPFSIADLMAKWLVGNKELETVLEPAFGLGVLSRALLNYNENLKIKGFEIDKNIFEKANSFFKENKNISIHLEDYMYNDWNNKYDGIICNPPYFKFHDYDNKNILKEMENRISCKLNGFTNLYTLFLLKSIYQLNKNGRAAYIIPSEFLNSDYGKLVKSYLIKSKTLRHIIVINFKENVFNDALTTASIILCANDNKSNKVQFSNVSDITDLANIENIIKSYPNYLTKEQTVEFENLDPEIKWRAYYQEQNALKYKHLISFTNYGKVVRGIATGANDYFTFNSSKVKKFGIAEKYLLPCICKAIDSKKSFFTKDDFQELKTNNKSIFLLNAINPDDNVNKYLAIGEEQEINKKFLTASRNPWYSLENRLPSPIWVSVFNRNGLRFIRNEAKISNLTTFHCIYLNMFSIPKTDLFFAYLLTDVSRQIFDDNRREYGNGLKKFEPNDINKSKILDLGYLSIDMEIKILKYYNLYRQSVIENNPDESFVYKINDIFIKHYT
ncbi:MAG: Eco57I restriction-modification methylase domain-containing protein [Patescibacteria group bacterium]